MPSVNISGYRFEEVLNSFPTDGSVNFANTDKIVMDDRPCEKLARVSFPQMNYNPKQPVADLSRYTMEQILFSFPLDGSVEFTNVDKINWGINYGAAKVFALCRLLLPFGVRFNFLNSHTRKLELSNIDFYAHLILRDATIKNSTPLHQFICKLEQIAPADAQDRYKFFRIIVRKVRELGISAKMRTFGPDQIENWNEQLNDRALERIWPRLYARIYNTTYLHTYVPKGFFVANKDRTSSEIQKLLSENPKFMSGQLSDPDNPPRGFLQGKNLILKAKEIKRFLAENPFLIDKIDLSLDNLQLSLIPDEIRLFKSVQLNNNLLTFLPESLNRMTSLTHLYAFRNQLETLLPGIRNPGLELLNVDQNKLTSVPREIGQLSRLRHLSLDKNNLQSLPDEIGDLSNLFLLSVSDNALTTLPLTMEKLKKLGRLYIERNHITQLPGWISKLPLEILASEGNTPIANQHEQGPSSKKQSLQSSLI